MKKAYEIAMKRLEMESGPTKKLSEEDKLRIAEIDRKCEARSAEQKLQFEAQFRAAQSYEEFTKLKDQLAETLASIEAQREKEKDAIWGHA